MKKKSGWKGIVIKVAVFIAVVIAAMIFLGISITVKRVAIIVGIGIGAWLLVTFIKKLFKLFLWTLLAVTIICCIYTANQLGVGREPILWTAGGNLSTADTLTIESEVLRGNFSLESGAINTLLVTGSSKSKSQPVVKLTTSGRESELTLVQNTSRIGRYAKNTVSTTIPQHIRTKADLYVIGSTRIDERNMRLDEITLTNIRGNVTLILGKYPTGVDLKAISSTVDLSHSEDTAVRIIVLGTWNDIDLAGFKKLDNPLQGMTSLDDLAAFAPGSSVYVSSNYKEAKSMHTVKVLGFGATIIAR